MFSSQTQEQVRSGASEKEVAIPFMLLMSQRVILMRGKVYVQFKSLAEQKIEFNSIFLTFMTSVVPGSFHINIYDYVLEGQSLK